MNTENIIFIDHKENISHFNVLFQEDHLSFSIQNKKQYFREQKVANKTGNIKFHCNIFGKTIFFKHPEKNMVLDELFLHAIKRIL